MPFVKILYSPKYLTQEMRKNLSEKLPTFVAKALNGPEGKVKNTDIFISFHEAGEHDRMPHDIAILVFAHHFPHRAMFLDRKAQCITQGASDIIGFPTIGICTWISLSTAGYHSMLTL